MAKWYDNEALIKFESPCKISVVGASNIGKTYFVRKLLEYGKKMFKTDFKNIYYHYGSAYQPIFDDMSKRISNLEFREGLLSDEQISAMAGKEHVCLVLDDLMFEVNNNLRFEKLWTVQSHHYNITVIYLTQNLFERGKAARTISLNTDVFCIFNHLRDKFQLMHFAKQAFYGNTGYFMKSFELATSKPFGYLIVDLDSRTDRLYTLRTNIFPGENTVVYKKEH